MKSKIFVQFLALLGGFLAVWFMLSRISFVSEDQLKGIGKVGERKLAELTLQGMDLKHSEFDAKELMPYIDSIGRRICDANRVSYDSIKVHIVKSHEVNAFALPDHHLVIYTGLLEEAKSAEEVTGIIGHEIGHMEKGHVMKKLMKELGLAMISTMIAGSENMEVIREAGRILSSSVFDRSQEEEADEYSLSALTAAHVDIEPFGNFLFRHSINNEMPEYLVWISTHPDSKDRAAKIFEQKKNSKYTPVPVLKTPWTSVVAIMNKDDDE